MIDNKKQIKDWIKEFEDKTPGEILSFFFSEFGEEDILATGLGAEGQVLTDLAAKTNQPFRIFTIDPGRLFPESYKLIERTNQRYNISITVYFPETEAVEHYIQHHGVNGFYNSVESRKACCRARKVNTLMRVLSTAKVWICGLRSDQSVTRTNMQLIEWDERHNLIKVNPLIYWSEKDVWDYIHQNNVPYNPLHDKGYPTIGCQPCTRPIRDGESIRSGRWWWESPNHKECGLHRD